MNLPDFRKLPRAIAIDLDGTLLDNQTRLSERNRRALERCIERGIPVIIATSRPARIFNRIFPADLARSCSYVLMNGAVARGNPPLAGYFKETLPLETLRELLAFGRRVDPAMRVTLEIDGYDFGVDWEIDYSMLWQRNSATPDMVLTIDEAIKRQPCKVALGGAGAPVDLPALFARLQERFESELSIVATLTGTGLLMVTTKNASKSEAIRKLLVPNGISLAEVLAFGDDLPDLDMLQACGTAVAMANAFPEVKAVCPYLTASNDEDGVAVVLEKMLQAIG
jgi:Cof subfamily protein (haloacid dehalogenase superfamily)